MACFRSEQKSNPNRSLHSGRLLFFFPMKLFSLAVAILLALLLCGCEFFSTPQERRGVNPEPFNSQAGWELTPYGSYQN